MTGERRAPGVLETLSRNLRWRLREWAERRREADAGFLPLEAVARLDPRGLTARERDDRAA